ARLARHGRPLRVRRAPWLSPRPRAKEAARPRRAAASGSLDVRRLLALRARDDVELHFLTFLEGLEPVHLDRAEVREQILTSIVGGYETVPLGVVEPFDGTRCHAFVFP